MSPFRDMMPNVNIQPDQRRSVLCISRSNRGCFRVASALLFRLANFFPRLTERTDSGAFIVNHRMVAEFSALVAAQAPLIIEGATPLAEGPLCVYWQHSRTLWPRRRRELDELCSEMLGNQSLDQIQRVVTIASDLLIGELLTRVAGAVLTACDRRQRLRHAEPIARNVLTVHQQCRASVLRLLLHSTLLPADQLAELDRLRRRVERWTDVLLGPLMTHYGNDLSDFAFDPRRALDFGEDQSQARFSSSARPAWSFLLAGLRSAFPNHPSHASSCDPTIPILRSILALFPEDAFHPEGAIQSLRRTRVTRASEHSEGPLDTFDHSTQRLRHDFASSAHRAPRASRRRPRE